MPDDNHSTISSANLLAEKGVFNQKWPAFVARSGQQSMAQSIDDIIVQGGSLLVEAPSGSGKTLAYLVPAISKRQKTIISTASRYLQQQLFNHDLPLVQKMLGTQRTVALLQGRRHYLCPYYLLKHLQNESQLSPYEENSLRRLWQRFRETGVGEISHLTNALPANLHTYASCDGDDCLGQQCPQYKDCPLMQARQQVATADIVIVNHSVLFSHHRLRQENLPQVLPQAELVIVDEAHRLTDFAEGIIGEQVSSAKLRWLLKESTELVRKHCPEQRQFIAFIKQLDQVITRLYHSIPSIINYQRHQHSVIVEQFVSALGKLAGNLKQLQLRSHELFELQLRVKVLLGKLKRIADAEGLCWVQASDKGFILKTVPNSLASLISNLFTEAESRWVFTSATLSVAGSFKQFAGSIGLQESLAVTNQPLLTAPVSSDGAFASIGNIKQQVVFCRVKTDIDYQRQAILYTPQLTVEPDHHDFTDQLVQKILPLLKAANGRVLILFSSHRSLQQASQVFTQYKAELAGYQLLIQQPTVNKGAISNHLPLIKAFKKAEKVALLATGSFWEGLDLSGAPLSAVIIDKLPFAPPNQPLVELRMGELNKYGVDAFQHYQLPSAVIRLRQGCGRLLRRIDDRGVIMIADPRLSSQPYGSVFIDSLPAMQRVTEIQSVVDFLAVNSKT